MEGDVAYFEFSGHNRLEQVYLNMPEVRFYFSGDVEQTGENLTAYLGKEKLELQSLQIFSQGEGGIFYYVLLDVSASIQKAEFDHITEALEGFGETLRPQDHMIFLTFGEEVTFLFDLDGGELAAGGAVELLAGLENTDQKTLLFEAVQRAAESAANVPASESTRRVIFVITDGEDIARGKATRDEALQTLGEKGIPVYGFTVEAAKRDAVNAFGEFSRATGGYLTVLSSGTEKEGFEAVREALLQSYEAVFTAGSNQVSHEKVSAFLEFSKENKKQQTDVLQDRWIRDEESPTVEEIRQEGTKQIKVLFSEPVEGVGSADHFRLEREGEVLVPVYASPGSEGTSVVLTFPEELEGGTYQLMCDHITDSSMEHNPLMSDSAGSAGSLWIEERETGEVEMTSEPPEFQFTGLFQTYGWALVLVLFVALTVGLLTGWKRLKKRQAIVTVENKAVLVTNTQVRHHMIMEERNWEEKQLFFCVEGQREEIPIRLKKSMIVGRASSCELIFDDPALSRQHFALELKEGKVLIRNLSQSGFTTVNGVRLGVDAYVLNPGDRIGAGQLGLTVRW